MVGAGHSLAAYVEMLAERSPWEGGRQAHELRWVAGVALVLTYAEGCIYPPVPVCVNVGAVRILGPKQLKISSLRNVIAG